MTAAFVNILNSWMTTVFGAVSHSLFISWHNWGECVLFAEGCTYHECRLGAAFVPELEGKFLATENFYHTSKVYIILSLWLGAQKVKFGHSACIMTWVFSLG